MCPVEWVDANQLGRRRSRAGGDESSPSRVTVTDDRERATEGADAYGAVYSARMGEFEYEHFGRMG